VIAFETDGWAAMDNSVLSTVVRNLYWCRASLCMQVVFQRMHELAAFAVRLQLVSVEALFASREKTNWQRRVVYVVVWSSRGGSSSRPCSQSAVGQSLQQSCTQCSARSGVAAYAQRQARPSRLASLVHHVRSGPARFPRCCTSHSSAQFVQHALQFPQPAAPYVGSGDTVTSERLRLKVVPFVHVRAWQPTPPSRLHAACTSLYGLYARDAVQYILHHASANAVQVTYLLGGGSDFSSGGPGKGMHSRLYQSVLTQRTWVSSCTAYSNIFEATGLLGVMASTPDPAKGDELVSIICQCDSLSACHLAGPCCVDLLAVPAGEHVRPGKAR
jgi:Peptidase M16 inactive domain